MRRIMIGLVVIALVSAACGGDTLGENLAENILENELGDGNVDIDISDDGQTVEVNVTTEDGESITIGGGEVPDELTVPLPKGGEVMNTFVSNDNVTVTVYWPQSEYDSIVSFYEDWVSGQPTDFDESTTSFSSEGNTFRNTNWFSSEADITISVADCFTMSGDALDSVCVSISEG